MKLTSILFSSLVFTIAISDSAWAFGDLGVEETGVSAPMKIHIPTQNLTLGANSLLGGSLDAGWTPRINLNKKETAISATLQFPALNRFHLPNSNASTEQSQTQSFSSLKGKKSPIIKINQLLSSFKKRIAPRISSRSRNGSLQSPGLKEFDGENSREVLSEAPLAAAPIPFSGAGPAQVIIIRHGEKPKKGNNLNARGRIRARALVGFFENNPAVTRYGVPAAIYAMAPGAQDGSLRPIETVTPLAQALNLTINENYTKDQIAALVDEIMNNSTYAGRMVLICWEHHVIPELAKAFGCDSAPTTWSARVFNRAWILTFLHGQVASFENIVEHVMPRTGAL